MLEILKNTLNSDRAELFILYSRRRVGKTELLKQIFIDNKNAVYFLGRFESPKDMVLRLFKIVAEKFEDKRLTKFPFRDFDEAFHYFSIIRSIAFGNTTTGRIMNDTGITKDVVGKYLSTLQEKAKKVKWGTGRREHYMIISKSGFDNNIIDKDVMLIDLNILETVRTQTQSKT